MKAEGDNRFLEGFVNVSLIICVGAMAIVGAIQDGMTGDYSLLAVKALLYLIIVMVLPPPMVRGLLIKQGMIDIPYKIISRPTF